MSAQPDRPVASLLRWLMRPAPRVVLVLGGALLVTALATVDASHRTRVLFSELETLRMERDRLLEERGRLLLERSAFSAYNRVESVAVDRLDMRMPEPLETRLVTP